MKAAFGRSPAAPEDQSYKDFMLPLLPPGLTIVATDQELARKKNVEERLSKLEEGFESLTKGWDDAGKGKGYKGSKKEWNHSP